jgi:hypothetical protein
MFVLSPDKYLLPDYKISPFSTKDMAVNSNLPLAESVDHYFKKRFPDRKFSYTVNGRSALNKALRFYDLKTTDTVTILTTTGNSYISSCVTGEVGKFCRWNQRVDSTTRVILVIHEFGYVYANVKDLRKYNLPIIEDSAYAFFSTDASEDVHNTGDFVIFSFPKMFPIQVGALLVYNGQHSVEQERWADEEMLPYIKKVMSHYVAKEEEIKSARFANYQRVAGKIKQFGFEERFPFNRSNVPGVYMFRVDDSSIDLKAMRDHVFDHGIQCSVFYGEHAFFIPVHQGLNDFDMEYFAEVIQSFLK